MTLLVVLLTAALLVLSNLSNAVSHDGVRCHNFGWPMVWWRLVIGPVWDGLQIHRLRLAVDAAVWLLLLVVAGGTCEWLMRRYRPRLRWSLRTMLVVTALVAACCGWSVVASRRARRLDEVVALQDYAWVWIERWGPRWLGLFGVERYFQHIVGAKFLSAGDDDDQQNEQILKRLKELPTIRLLYLQSNQLSPATVGALDGMPQLRILSIDGDDSHPGWRPCLAAVGRMSRLEQLCLVNPNGPALAELAALRRLRGLHLLFGSPDDGDNLGSSPPLLASLPIFPRLETLTFDGPYLVDDDLRRLAAQPNLKALRIEAPIIGADLAAMRALDALEELTIVSRLEAADILALRGLNRLKTLHIRNTRRPRSSNDFDRAELSALRRARPGIVIDDDTEALAWNDDGAVPPEYVQPGNEPQLASASAPWLHAWFWRYDDQVQWLRDLDLPW